MEAPQGASARAATHQRPRSAGVAKNTALPTPRRAAQDNHVLLEDDFLHPMRSSIISKL